MSSPPAAPVGPPPGWYLDHTSGQWCWWDGWQWVLPTAGPPAIADEPMWLPDTPTLHLPAAVLGIALIVFLTVSTRLTELLPETPAAWVSLGLFVVSTLGMPLAAWYGSRRWGTGRIAHDLGLRFRWIDVPLGIAGAVVLTVTLMVINLLWYVVDLPSGSNLTEVSEGGRDLVTFVILFVSAGLIAPVTEELLFRGLIQRGLSSRWSTWAAIGLQAVVFGAAHVTPSEGWGNADLIVSLAVLGLGLGLLARLTGRLGTAIWAHALFNCTQLALLWISLG